MTLPEAPDPTPDQGQGGEADRWISLREAARATGVAIPTLRKWYSNGDIASRMADGPFGPQREVILREVLQRAQSSPARGAGKNASPSLAIPVEQLWAMYQQAGQEAQEARERAAKLEGEVEVLREQLRRVWTSVGRSKDGTAAAFGESIWSDRSSQANASPKENDRPGGATGRGRRGGWSPWRR